jgi:hypothetical protein
MVGSLARFSIRPLGPDPGWAIETPLNRRKNLMILPIRYLLGILATIGATYAAPVLFHFFRALSLVQVG